MAYKVGQFYYFGDKDLNHISKLGVSATAARITHNYDLFPDGTIKPNLVIYDEALTLSSNEKFRPEEVYFFRCDIQRKPYEQIFYVSLYNSVGSDSSTEENPKQFLKKIIVAPGSFSEWVTYDFVFVPIALDTELRVEFDSILFELQLSPNDFIDGSKISHIIYRQLGTVNNIINKCTERDSILKLGIQSHPGLSLCINREEMKLSRTGIFELRDGVLPIDFFSVIVGGEESFEEEMEEYKQTLKEAFEAVSEKTEKEKREKYAEYESIAYVDEVEFGKADAFTLDYGYEE